MKAQLSMFPTATAAAADSLVGLKVKLDRAVDANTLAAATSASSAPTKDHMPANFTAPTAANAAAGSANPQQHGSSRS
jgi:hypothetical protein